MRDNPIAAQITSFKKEKSKHGGDLYHVFLKDDFGFSWRTYLYPHLRNWGRWKPLLQRGAVLSGLSVKDIGKRLIDADSFVRLVEVREFKKPIQEKKQETKQTSLF